MKRVLAILVIMGGILSLISTPEFSLAKEFLDKIEREYGTLAKRRTLALIATMNDVRDHNEKEKLEAINEFFNAVPYASDQTVWGVSDYWETRLEFLGKDRGDCEDYVIAKYFTLLELGVSSKKLSLFYVKSLKYNVAHLVLAYYETPQTVPLILDNYNFRVLPATQRTDLIPISSFSGEDLMNAKQAALGKIVPASAKQTRPWDELIIRRKD